MGVQGQMRNTARCVTFARGTDAGFALIGIMQGTQGGDVAVSMPNCSAISGSWPGSSSGQLHRGSTLIVGARAGSERRPAFTAELSGSLFGLSVAALPECLPPALGIRPYVLRLRGAPDWSVFSCGSVTSKRNSEHRSVPFSQH